jgi:hypothetical protein
MLTQMLTLLKDQRGPYPVQGGTLQGKKKVSHFPFSNRDVTNQTLPVREKLNYSRQGRVW